MSHSIGIIGGADRPTAIFITGNPTPVFLAIAVGVLLIILTVRYFRKRNKK